MRFVKTVIGIFVIVIILGVLSFYLFIKNPSQKEDTQNDEVLNILRDIEKGNSYITTNNFSDNCFPYRYFHKGCYYEGKLKFTKGLLVNDFKNYNLTLAEKIDLCYKFVFNGSTAYCLYKNEERNKCLTFAKNDEYLVRICNLKEGETIPTEGMWDANYRDNPIPTRYINSLII